MPVIYEPKGRAREYSPLALNLYLQCVHGCKYCYCPSALQKKRDFFFQKASPRKDVIRNLEKELIKFSPKKQVLLSFIGDVYSDTTDDNKTTKEALQLLNDYKVPASILTKGGKNCLKDIELFKKFEGNIQIGTTLTFDNDENSKEYEPFASLPNERLEMLTELKNSGIKTFVSFEPVIDPTQTLNLIKQTLELDNVDTYKIGKINNYNGLDKKIDWTLFLNEVLFLLRKQKKNIYIKHDLRQATNGIQFYGNEVLPDEHNVG